MAMFDMPQNLEQALGNQAQQKIDTSQDAYAQARRRLAARQASGGQVGGVRNYARTDLATGEAGIESDIYNELASALAGVPMEDWTDTRQNQRNLSLAELIGKMNKPSSLQEALGGVKLATDVAATGAAFL